MILVLGIGSHCGWARFGAREFFFTAVEWISTVCLGVFHNMFLPPKKNCNGHMAEQGRSKIRRETSVRDRIHFFEEIITEGEESSTCGSERKLKSLPRRVRTPRGEASSDESGQVSGERSSGPRKESSREHFNASKRRFAVQEILTSERSYVNMLEMLVTVSLVLVRELTHTRISKCRC